MFKIIKRLTAYYGLLQLVHFSFLTWGGYMILRSGKLIFLALPPLEGWSPQVVPFLMGLGLADGIAAGIGVYFAYQGVVKKSWYLNLGLISISIALASAVVFLVGTLASGAWKENPTEYLSMVVLFSPIPLLYFLLLKASATGKITEDEFTDK
jgi:hypothetical protein